MLQKLNLYWRWTRRKVQTGQFAQLSSWGLRPRHDAAGDNFPGLDRALLISRLMEGIKL